MTLDLAPLIAFGREAETLGTASIDVGGFIVPGAESDPNSNPGQETSSSVYVVREAAREETRPATGSRKGSRSSRAETASGTSTYAIWALAAKWRSNGITAEEFDELDVFYPDVRVTASSSRSVFLGMTVGLFQTLPYRARVVMEVPRPECAPVMGPRDSMRDVETWSVPSVVLGNRGPEIQFAPRGLVPPVRTWARWAGSVAHGTHIVSHHQYPDFSICACMHHQWLRGVHKLVDYAGLCVSWIGKVIHEQELGFYPGRQHVREWVRVERDRVAEFCGCGSAVCYNDCCRNADLTFSADQLEELRRATWTQYFQELSLQGRPLHPPREAWCLT